MDKEKKVITPKKVQTGHRGKQYKAVKAKVDVTRVYNATDALALVKETSYAKFDASVELHAVVRRENVSVQVALPHSTGKTKKVVLVTPEVIAELEAGKVTFDVILATPETMPKLVKFAKLLGPRGMMPNPKNGTLVKDASAIDSFSTDTISVKTEKKAPVIHVSLGKVSMDNQKLADNLAAVIAAINPKIIMKAYLTSSMGPSVKLQVS
jgi:large subunit ribosomal protein L1